METDLTTIVATTTNTNTTGGNVLVYSIPVCFSQIELSHSNV